MGAGAQRVLCTASDKQPGRWQRRAEGLALRFGAPVLLFSWVPLLGDPLCAVAGWLRWARAERAMRVGAPLPGLAIAAVLTLATVVAGLALLVLLTFE